MNTFFKKYGLIVFALLTIVIVSIFLESEGSIVAWSILSVVLILMVYIIERFKSIRKLDELRKENMLSEIAILKSQLNPHFFFNTLNNLYSLSLTAPDTTPIMLLKLAELMRYTIYKGKEEKVSLADEWEYIKNYVELHKIRYKNEPSIVLHANLEKGTGMIPPLILITLVENAFKHGVEKLETDAFVNINLLESEHEIVFEVINNYDSSKKSSDGIGLANLRRRLELQYPNKHFLEITKTDVRFNVKLILK